MANAVQPVVINQHPFSLPENAGAKRSALEQIIEWNNKSSGAFRCMQLIEKVSKATALVLEELGNTLSSFFFDLSGKLGVATGMMAITRVPSALSSGWEALTSGGTVKGPEGYPLRGYVQRLHNVADSLATVGYAASMAFNSTAIKNMADIPGFVSDVTDASMAAEDMTMAGKYLEHIDAGQIELKERFADTQKEAMLRLAKAAISVASGAIGLLVLAFGGPILPAAVLLGVSLTGVITAMSAYFFKETRNYDLVKFFEWREPAVLFDGQVIS